MDTKTNILHLHIKQGVALGSKPRAIFHNAHFNQAICEYYAKKNWSGLLAYLRVLEKRGNLPDAWRWQIGQVYCNLGDIDSALDYLFSLHVQYPDQADIQLAIIGVLSKTRFTVDNFHWIAPPKYQMVREDVLLSLIEVIALRQKAVPLKLLTSYLRKKKSISIDEFDLIVHCQLDPRFSIEIRGCYFRSALVDIRNMNQRAQARRAL